HGGRFRCLHTTCAKRTSSDMLTAVGFAAAAFDVLPDVNVEDKQNINPKQKAIRESMPSLRDIGITFTGKNGDVVELTESNLMKFFSSNLCGMEFAHDDFTQQKAYRCAGAEQWSYMHDQVITQCVHAAERHLFRGDMYARVKRAISLIASQNHIDTAKDWLARLAWDGAPRVDRFFTRYYNVEPSESQSAEYLTAVARYQWSGLASRLLDPGCKADMVVSITGEQGAGKTLSLQVLAEPVPTLTGAEAFGSADFKLSDRDLATLMQGKAIFELGELLGLGARKQSAVKAFISCRIDKFVPKYSNDEAMVKRRCLLIGTTNRPDYLVDDTGNRRWLPVTCGKVDIEALRADAVQLWAEGAHLAREHGVLWQDAHELAAAARQAARSSYAFEEFLEPIENWLAAGGVWYELDTGARGLKTSDVAAGLGMNLLQCSNGQRQAISNAMKYLKFDYVNSRHGGAKGRYWVSVQ
ncbi:MAG: VapE domain-containing protein, partial [Shewanella sp.]